MKAITVLNAAFCASHGGGLKTGKTYRVPKEVSEADAKALVAMGRAAWSEGKAAKATPDDTDPPEAA